MDNELIIRIFIFGALLLLMLLWEALAPRRAVPAHTFGRRFNNLLLLLLDILVVRFCFPIAAVGTAIVAADKGWGLFNLVDLNPVPTFLFSIILLDLAIYLQHVVFHKVSFLWLIHRVHHTDLQFDVTTGVRFHPIEIMLSMLLKMLVVLLLGAPVMAVIVFELLLNGLAMFNHGNVNIPQKVDRYLRYLVVTPDMHRVHHSQIRVETDSNYGFFLPVWDRFFGTYRDQPEYGHRQMKIGLKEFESSDVVNIISLLIQPLSRNKQSQSQEI